MEKNIYDNYLAILREEMVPAMGCTEPIALAYGAARAREVLGKEPEHIVAKCSGNIIKNVRCVIIPNSGGLKGIPAGVVLGAVAGDAALDMEVLSKVTDEGRKRCRELLDADICKVELLDTPVVLHIVIEMSAGEDTVCLEIKYDHINVTRIEKNGEILLDADRALEEKEAADRSLLNLEDIREFADTVELSDVKILLDTQIKSNMAIAHEGMTGKYGLGIGRVIRENYSHDMLTRMRSLTAAASEARMGGCDMPVVINSGSGNQFRSTDRLCKGNGAAGLQSVPGTCIFQSSYRVSETLYRQTIGVLWCGVCILCGRSSHHLYGRGKYFPDQKDYREHPGQYSGNHL